MYKLARVFHWFVRGGVSKDAAPVKKPTKKNRNFHALNWLFSQTTHVDIAPWNFACWVVSGN